jgi:hypothetical protein
VVVVAQHQAGPKPGIRALLHASRAGHGKEVKRESAMEAGQEVKGWRMQACRCGTSHLWHDEDLGQHGAQLRGLPLHHAGHAHVTAPAPHCTAAAAPGPPAVQLSQHRVELHQMGTCSMR